MNYSDEQLQQRYRFGRNRIMYPEYSNIKRGQRHRHLWASSFFSLTSILSFVGFSVKQKWWIHTSSGKRNNSVPIFTGTNAFRNYMLTAQGQSVSLWRSLLILLSRWDIDSINVYTFWKTLVYFIPNIFFGQVE
jgi:hypothetical protein